MQKEQKQLTVRQWILYRYLKKNYADGVYISKKQICEDIKQYHYSATQTRMCREIEVDVRALNQSDEIEKIIVSNRVGYKIGNMKEVLEYLVTREKRDKKSLALTSKLWNKAKLNRQEQIDLDTDEITEVESFMD